MTEAHACEQLAQGCYLEADRPRFEPATFRIASERSTVKPHRPPTWWRKWIYTVATRNVLFFTITPVFLGLFLHFIHQWDRNEYSTERYKIQFHHDFVYRCGNGIYSSVWPWPNASCIALDRTGCAQISQNVVQCLSFSIFVRVFLDRSLGKVPFIFPQVLIKIMSSELNIFPYSISLQPSTILPLSLFQPHSGTSSSTCDSPIPSPITCSSSVSPLCSSITSSVFHFRLKTYLFHKSYPS